MNLPKPENKDIPRSATNSVPPWGKTYSFIQGYAAGRKFTYTPRALALAQRMHEGQYRKGAITINGVEHRIPYVYHVLKVCSTLISLQIPMPDEELDILYTCALLHDTLEDAEEFFPNGGIEYETKYGFPPIVGETIRLVSKRSGATPEELYDYFNTIKDNRYALLVKLADRSHNVEDLYNMKNIGKYIKETRDYFLSHDSLCSYGRQYYPELANAITVLKSKIASLTDATEVMHARYAHRCDEQAQILTEFVDDIINSVGQSNADPDATIDYIRRRAEDAMRIVKELRAKATINMSAASGSV